MTSLTQSVQRQLSQHIQSGDKVIDATAGNGWDTLFLATQVGNEGKVYAFDIQAEAIESSQKKLEEKQLLQRVDLFHCSHDLMLEKIPSDAINTISTIMFNLGYLPGSDKSIITQTESTLLALDASLALLKPDGRLSVVVYPGHSGGDTEAQAVMQWSKHLNNNLNNNWQLEVTETPGPVALMVSGSTRYG